MLQLLFFYNLRRQSGHYYSLFELRDVMNQEQTWSVFDQGLKSKNVVFCIFQLFEVSHEKN